MAINVRQSSENVEMNASSLQEKAKTTYTAIDLAGCTQAAAKLHGDN